MSTQLVTNYFRLHNVKQFRESINETANSVYYVFAARSLPYTGGDSLTPTISNTVNETLYNAYENMVFGKRVSINDVCAVTRRYNWTSNTVYDAYRSDEDLSEKQYFVCINATSTYHYFKCLDNNGNVQSTVQPDVTQTSPDDDFYSTSDGYVWKYMFSVDSTTFNKFATTDFMPVLSNNQVVANAIPGAIDVIVVSYRGSNYNTYLTNTFVSTDIKIGGDTTLYGIAADASPVADFYNQSFLYIVSGTGAGQGRKITDYIIAGSSKRVRIESEFAVTPSVDSVYEITPSVLILGDGTNAVARAIVNTAGSNSIYQIEILNRGLGYTYATAQVQGNTGGVQNSATLSIVLGPKNGHGSDPESELGVSGLCISTKFSNNESGAIPTQNDYRTIGLLKDPLYANVELTVSSLTGSFEIGETVIQNNTLAQGTVSAFDAIQILTLTDVNGVFATGQTVVGQTTSATGNVSSYLINGKAKNFDTFDQRHRYSFTFVTGTFDEDELVYQFDPEGALSVNARVHSYEGNVVSGGNLYLTHVRGTINTGNTLIGDIDQAVANVTYYYPPELIVGSGEVLYLENRSPITRSNNQSENIKLILQF